MATSDTSPDDNGYGNPYLDSLIMGNKWVGTVTWRLAPSAGQSWSAAERDAFVAAFAKYSEISNLTFSEVGSDETANLNEYEATSATWNDTAGTITLADHHQVGAGPAPNVTDGRYNTGDGSWDSLIQGGQGFSTIVHEIGHALGLDHPHDGAELFPGVARDAAFNDLGDDNLNQAIFSVMSYNRGWRTRPDAETAPDITNTAGHAIGLMAFDIAAIQKLYGVNWSTRSGDNTYLLPGANADGVGWTCIWDGGGVDTISNAGSALAATIDLRAAPLTGVNAGGYVSYALNILGGFTIANKVVIENAVGGSGADTILGNNAANVLEGGDGADTISGNGGDDVLIGGKNADTLDGGEGFDLASFADSDAGVAIDLAAGTVNHGYAAGDTLASIEGLIGSAHVDRLTGDDGRNELVGRGGIDVLKGGDGDDTLRGGLEGDDIDGGDGDDTLYGADTDLIRNGGFEGGAAGLEPNEAGRVVISGESEWGNVDSVFREFVSASARDPKEGRFAVDLEVDGIGNATLRQIVEGAVEGQRYRIAFDIAKLNADATAAVEVWWGGVLQETFTPGTDWTKRWIEVTGAGSNSGNRLEFREVGEEGDDHGTLLDNVRMFRIGGIYGDGEDPFDDGADTFHAGTGSDAVFGHGGNDTAYFDDASKTSPFDSFDGGSGVDLLVMDWSGATNRVSYFGYDDENSAKIGVAESFRVMGSENGHRLYFKNVERFDLIGSNYDDLLRGGYGDDRLQGGDGKDILISGGGVDILDGGEDVDTARFKVAEISGTIDRAAAASSAGYTLSSGTRLVSIENIELEAGDGDDSLDMRGGSGAGGGAFAFRAGKGDDTLKIDLANSNPALFDGGEGSGDFLLMDWRDATRDIRFVTDEEGIASYRSVIPGSSPEKDYVLEFIDVERFELYGGSGNDDLRGGVGDDLVNAGLGRDDVQTEGGSDTLVVDWDLLGRNLFYGTANLDYHGGSQLNYDELQTYVLTGSLASGGYEGAFGFWGDTYYNNDEDRIDFKGIDNFHLTFGAGRDVVTTGDGDDILVGNGGDDVFSTGKGFDVVSGSTDSDSSDRWRADKSAASAMTVDLNDGAFSYTIGSRTATITGIDVLGVDATRRFIASETGGDEITTQRYETDGFARGGDDFIATRGGDDTVSVFTGHDHVDMGAGTADTLIVDYAVSTISYTATLMKTAFGYSGSLIGDLISSAIEFAGVDIFDIKVGSGNDAILTGDGNDRVFGGRGDDYLVTGKGADTVDGGLGLADRWEADKSLASSAFKINLNNTVQAEAVSGLTGEVRGIEALGTDASNRFKTGSGGDEITDYNYGLGINDFIDTGAGADTVVLHNGRDQVSMGSGLDTLKLNWGGATGDLLAGAISGTGEYSGSVGFRNAAIPYDRKVAFTGVDRFDFTLGSGDDEVRSGAGADAFNGGRGFDTVVYAGAKSAYTVTQSGSQWLVKHKTSGVTDTLTGIDRLAFDDGTQAIGSDKTEYSDDRYTKGVLVSGGSVASDIDVLGDTDWFKVQLTAGVEYTFEMKRSGANASFDPRIWGIFKEDGFAPISGTGNNNASAGTLDAKVVYTPTQSGTYFIEARGATNVSSAPGIGSYVLTMQVPAPPVIVSNGGGATASVSVKENTLAVTTVVASDPNGTAVSYAITGGADKAKFTINATTGALSFVGAPNFEVKADSGANNVYDVVVVATDAAGMTDTQAIAVAVTDVNEAPVFTSNGGGASAAVSVKENTKAVSVLAAVDPDAGATRTFSIVGGADAAKFTIDARTSTLNFVTAPNFEVKADKGANNVYDVVVQVSDGKGGTDTQAIAVSVTDVNEAPAITSNGGGVSAAVSVKENTRAVTTVVAIDPDAAATRTFTIVGGADKGLFTINAASGALGFVAAPDWETPGDAGRNNVYDVVVQVSDGKGGTDTQAIAVGVTDVDGAPRTGTDGNNTLTGTDEKETLSGKGGNDVLKALKGADTLDGGTGRDLLYGGVDTQTDTFVFRKGDSGNTAATIDTLFDFKSGVDKIDLRGIDADPAPGSQDLRWVTKFAPPSGAQVDGQIRLVDSGKDYKVEIDYDGKGVDMVLLVADVNSLSKADFLL